MGTLVEIPVGSKFGLLTVVSFSGTPKGHAEWNCLCECGKMYIARGANLRRGRLKSCGCIRPVVHDLTGQTFGSWKVIGAREIANLKGGKKAFWLCRCVCGFEKKVSAAQLIFGATTKCRVCSDKITGTQRRGPKGLAARNAILGTYKRGAKVRSLSWLLTEEQFDKLTKLNCYYCGLSPSNEYGADRNGSFIYSGIDRVDNARGYELGNVVPCCGICNQAKSDMSAEEFITWANRVANHTRKGNATLPQTNS